MTLKQIFFIIGFLFIAVPSWAVDATFNNLKANNLSLTGTPLQPTSGGNGCNQANGNLILFSAVPATPQVNTQCSISDAPACVAGTPVTVGGGATACTIVWNGTNWQPAGGAIAPTSGGLASCGTGLNCVGSTVSLATPVPVANGGTGAAAAGPTAAQNIGAAPSGIDINSSGQVTGTHLALPMPVAQGGKECASPTVFASLPVSPHNGAECYISDAPSCPLGSAVTIGGGMTPCQLVWNGANWLAGTQTSSGSGQGTINISYQGSLPYYSPTSTGSNGNTISGVANSWTPVEAFGLATTNTGAQNDAAFCVAGGGPVNFNTCTNTASLMYNIYHGFIKPTQLIWAHGIYSFALTRSIDLTNAFNGMLWSGGGGNNSATGGCGTTLQFLGDVPQITTITGASYSGGVFTYTATGSLPLVGDFGAVEGIVGSSGGALDISGKVQCSGSGACSSNQFQIYSAPTAVSYTPGTWSSGGTFNVGIFGIDGANRWTPRDLCVKGAGSGIGMEKDQIAIVPNESNDHSTILNNWVQSYNTDWEFLFQFIANGADMSASSFYEVNVVNVTLPIWNEFVQSILGDFDGSRFIGDTDTVEYEGPAPQLSFHNTHLACANGGSTSNNFANFHYMPGMIQATNFPNTSVAESHFETVNNCRHLRDDATVPIQVVWRENSSIPPSSSPSIQLNINGMLSLSGWSWQSGRTISKEIELDTYGAIGNNLAPTVLITNASLGSNGTSFNDFLPTEKVCPSLTAPPVTQVCPTYVPSNGVVDSAEPNVQIRDSMVWIANGASNVMQMFEYSSNTGRYQGKVLPNLSGGLALNPLITPTNCTCTCTGGSGTNYYYQAAVCDANSNSFTTGQGCSAFSSQNSCSGPASLLNPTKECTEQCSSVPAGQYYVWAGRTNGAENLFPTTGMTASPGVTKSSSFVDDGHLTPSGALWTLNSSGNFISGGHIGTKQAALTTSSLAAGCGGAATIASNSTDLNGQLTVSTSGLGTCTLTYNSLYGAAPSGPICIRNSAGTMSVLPCTTTGTVLTFNPSGTPSLSNGDVLTWFTVGK